MQDVFHLHKPSVVLVVERDIGQHKNQTRTARMATRQQLTNQANQAGMCFVLNEYSDDPDTSRHGQQRRDIGDRSRSQDSMEQNVQEWMYRGMQYGTVLASPRTCVSFSLGHKNMTVST